MTSSPARPLALAFVALVVPALIGCGATSSAIPSGGSASPAASASPGAGPSDDAARVGGWTADLQAILPGLERLHPDPFHGTPKADLEAAVAALAATIPTATDDQLMVGVLRVVALVSSDGRDAHTGAYVWGAGAYATHSLPLRLWVFPEGIAVVDALPPYENLIGRVIASLDGQPIADVVAALEPLMPHDNDATRTLLTPRFLLTTEILHGAGLADDPTRVRVAFEDAPGTPVEIDAIPTADYNAWATPYGLHLPTRTDVPYLARSEEPVWTRVDGGDTLYVQYNRVTRLASNELAPLTAAIAEPAIRRLIVDIRHNYGGETFGYPPLADALVAGAPGWSAGLYLITGRNTFSAASLFAADLTSRAQVTVVGEPMGGSPSLYGNARPIQLPWSGLSIDVATERFSPVAGDERLDLPVDLPVNLTLADFLAGRDPALASIEGGG